MTTVVILAAGSGIRSHPHIKQLWTIHDEPIILRTIRLVKEVEQEARVYVVTYVPEIIDTVEGKGASVIRTSSVTSCVAESILISAPFWSSRNVILHGDVVYSDETIRRILTTDGLYIWGGKFRRIANNFLSPPSSRLLLSPVSLLLPELLPSGFFLDFLKSYRSAGCPWRVRSCLKL